jgi:hypothetical protein
MTKTCTCLVEADEREGVQESRGVGVGLDE